MGFIFSKQAPRNPQSAGLTLLLQFLSSEPKHAPTGTQSEISTIYWPCRRFEIENASTLRKQDMMFAILKQLADNDVAIYGSGAEALSDSRIFTRPGVKFYLQMISMYRCQAPALIAQIQLKVKSAPKDGERYFALLKLKP